MANAFDATEYPQVEPADLTVGDRWLWKRVDLTDYDNTLYTLTYQALAQGTTPQSFTLTATASGSDYLIEVASTTTDDYVPGTYSWAAYITRDSDSERLRIGAGVWRVRQNFAVDTTDPRTHAQIQISALEAKITKLNARLHSSYSMGARSATLVDIAATRRELNHWLHARAAEINTQRQRQGKASANNVRAKF